MSDRVGSPASPGSCLGPGEPWRFPAVSSRSLREVSPYSRFPCLTLYLFSLPPFLFVFLHLYPHSSSSWQLRLSLPRKETAAQFISSDSWEAESHWLSPPMALDQLYLITCGWGAGSLHTDFVSGKWAWAGRASNHINYTWRFSQLECTCEWPSAKEESSSGRHVTKAGNHPVSIFTDRTLLSSLERKKATGWRAAKPAVTLGYLYKVVSPVARVEGRKKLQVPRVILFISRFVAVNLFKQPKRYLHAVFTTPASQSPVSHPAAFWWKVDYSSLSCKSEVFQPRFRPAVG